MRMQSGNPIRIGILGAARIAPWAAIRPARRVEGVEVTAVAARDPARAARFARRYRIPRVLDTYDALLADSDVDAVYIPTPNGLHGVWALRAIEAGKHVLLEKPFTADAAEAREVADAADRGAGVVMEAFHYRYHPLAIRMREIAASGRLGAMLRVETAMFIPLPRRSDIRYDWHLAGGATMDVGTYCLHMLRLLGLEEPRVVDARATPARTHPQVDRSMQADLAFPSGHTGRIVCSLWDPRRPFHVSAHLVGERGRLDVTNPVTPQLYHRLRLRVDGSVRTERFGRRPTYQYQLEAFRDAITSGRQVLTEPSDAVRQMELIDAVYTAAGLEPRRPTPLSA